MKYLTTYYRRQGEGGCSLLLQQYVCRQAPVCFACLCTADGGDGGTLCRDMAERLREWSRRVPWQRAAGRPGAWLERLERELEDLLEDCGRVPLSHEMKMKLTLFLGIGEEILVLGGGQSLCLVSTSFGRGKVTKLPGQFRGRLEPGAGLLLATEAFMKNVEGKSLEEALRLWEIGTEEQAARRLKEIGTRQESWISEGTEVQRKFPSREPAAAILLIGRGEEDCVHRQQGEI